MKASDEVYLIKKEQEKKKYRHYREGKLDLEATFAYQYSFAHRKHGGPPWWVLSRPLSQRPHHRLQALAHVLPREEQRRVPSPSILARNTVLTRQMFSVPWLAWIRCTWGRKSKNEIVFRAGDLRSTYDEELLEKSSDAGVRDRSCT